MTGGGPAKANETRCWYCAAAITPATEPLGVIYRRVLSERYGGGKLEAARWESAPSCSRCWSVEFADRMPVRVRWGAIVDLSDC